MSKGKISIEKIETQALYKETSDPFTDKLDELIYEAINNEVRTIISIGKTVTYKLLTNRLQLYYPGITSDELLEDYGKFIQKCIENYE